MSACVALHFYMHESYSMRLVCERLFLHNKTIEANAFEDTFTIWFFKRFHRGSLTDDANIAH